MGIGLWVQEQGTDVHHPTSSSPAPLTHVLVGGATIWTPKHEHVPHLFLPRHARRVLLQACYTCTGVQHEQRVGAGLCTQE